MVIGGGSSSLDHKRCPGLAYIYVYTSAERSQSQHEAIKCKIIQEDCRVGERERGLGESLCYEGNSEGGEDIKKLDKVPRKKSTLLSGARL